MEISQFFLTAITKTYPNIVTIDPLCILVPFAMGRVVCHICRPAEPCRTASPSTGRSGNLWPLPRLPTPNHSTRNSAQRQAPKKGAFSMTRKRLVCLRTPVSHQRQLRRRSADEVGFVQSGKLQFILLELLSGEKWTSCAAAGKAGPGARKRSARPEHDLVIRIVPASQPYRCITGRNGNRAR